MATTSSSKIVEVDPKVEQINGQSYLTITQDEGRKLMQRITKPGEADNHSDEPDFVLIENPQVTQRKRSISSIGGSFSAFCESIAVTSRKEMRTLRFYQALGAEFLGTLILTMIISGLGVKLDPNSVNPNIAGAFGAGLTVAFVVWVTNSVSGGNVNPAISIALVVTHELHILKGVCYILAQLLGAICGAAILNGLLPADVQAGAGVTLINPKVPLLNAFGVEAICTFVLSLVVFACIDKDRTDLGGSYPFSIGIAVIVGALFGGAYTGASLNPARSFGPAVIQNVWNHHWIYWLGPITGSLCAAIVYKFILKIRPKSK